jgi:ribosomal-protein-alanine N-acetyltransferase
MADLPVLTTARTMITPFTAEHITDAYVGWLNDPEVVRFSRQRFQTHTKDSCRAFYESFRSSLSHFSAIIAGGRHIGNVSTQVNREDNIADISLLIGDKTLWGQGYGAEVWGAVMAALLDAGLRRVTGGCMADNAGMIHVFQKTGMTPYYVRPGYFLRDGQPVDSVHYKKDKA